MYGYGGTRRRHRKRGGLGFDNMSSKAADEFASDLSKKKIKKNLKDYEV